MEYLLRKSWLLEKLMQKCFVLKAENGFKVWIFYQIAEKLSTFYEKFCWKEKTFFLLSLTAYLLFYSPYSMLQLKMESLYFHFPNWVDLPIFFKNKAFQAENICQRYPDEHFWFCFLLPTEIFKNHMET